MCSDCAGHTHDHHSLAAVTPPTPRATVDKHMRHALHKSASTITKCTTSTTSKCVRRAEGRCRPTQAIDAGAWTVALHQRGAARRRTLAHTLTPSSVASCTIPFAPWAISGPTANAPRDCEKLTDRNYRRRPTSSTHAVGAARCVPCEAAVIARLLLLSPFIFVSFVGPAPCSAAQRALCLPCSEVAIFVGGVSSSPALSVCSSPAAGARAQPQLFIILSAAFAWVALRRAVSGVAGRRSVKRGAVAVAALLIAGLSTVQAQAAYPSGSYCLPLPVSGACPTGFDSGFRCALLACVPFAVAACATILLMLAVAQRVRHSGHSQRGLKGVLHLYNDCMRGSL
jgi:hypothetical protein